MRIFVLFFSLLVATETLAQTRSYDTLPISPEYYNKRYALFKKEPIVKGRVIMVGNSITEAADWKVLLNDTTVINRGISGDVTFGVINRIKDITVRKPSKVFLLIGINDLALATPDEVIIENIFSVVSKIKSASPTTAIFVQSILPTNDSFKNLYKTLIGKGEHIITINTQLKKYAEKLKYTYIDLYSHFLDAEGRMDARLSNDGLHLNSAGYARLIEILKKEKYL